MIVITGASSGVGRAAAHAFAEAGAAIALLARSAESLEASAREVEALGGKAIAITCDVADARAVDAAAEEVERSLGPIDVWVNNAMVTVLAPVAEMTPEEFGRVTAVTYLGTVHGTMAALRRMRARNRGTIVQVGSALAYRSIPLQSAYCGSKAAIRAVTDSLRSELLHDRSGVRVTMVQLPAVNTPQFKYARNKMPRRPRPVAPVFAPELMGTAIVYAAAHAPRELYVAGSTLKAIAAQRLAPGFADRLLAGRGYSGQQTGEADQAARDDNLFETVPGDHGTAGPFDEESRSDSLQFELRRRFGRPQAAALAVALIAAAAAAINALRRRR